MRITISIGFILFANSICSGQVRDSVCIHKFNQHYWQSIRPADSIIYSRYISNSEYFKKVFKKDSLFIKLNDHACPPKTIFIGEFTTSDSIHIIDFIEDVRPYLRVNVEGICDRLISRNLLPQLQNITLSSNIDSAKYKFKFGSCDLYIKNDNGVLKYKITRTAISPEARNSIMGLKENHYIILDNVKIEVPDGIRTIQGVTYQITN